MIAPSPQRLLLGWCHPAFSVFKSPLPHGPELETLLRLAERNKLSYLLCSRAKEGSGSILGRCEEILREGQKNLAQQRLTLEFIGTALQDIPYLVIKSYKAAPYITWDIDIQVTPNVLEEAVRRLIACGASHLTNPGLPRILEARLVRPRGAVMRKEGLVEIDVYQDSSWSGWMCLDNSLLWHKPVTREVAGVPCLVPNNDGDLLLNLAHILFNHGEMHLLDFLYLHDLRAQVDERGLEPDARRYGWGSSYRAMLGFLDKTWDALENPRNRRPPSFPLMLPVGLILRAYGTTAVCRTSRIPGAPSWNTWLNAAIKLTTMMIYRGR